MHLTHVTLEVMRLRGVAQFFSKRYSVYAWDFPAARDKAMALARAEGLEPQRIINTFEGWS